jgi:hypothetical protein
MNIIFYPRFDPIWMFFRFLRTKKQKSKKHHNLVLRQNGIDITQKVDIVSHDYVLCMICVVEHRASF